MRGDFLFEGRIRLTSNSRNHSILRKLSSLQTPPPLRSPVRALVTLLSIHLLRCLGSLVADRASTILRIGRAVFAAPVFWPSHKLPCESSKEKNPAGVKRWARLAARRSLLWRSILPLDLPLLRRREAPQRQRQFLCRNLLPTDTSPLNAID